MPANDVVCNGCVGTTDIANHSITSVKIKNGTIRAADIASNAITSSRIVNGEVRNADIAVDAIRSGNIKNGEVRTLDLANNAVTFDKLSVSLQDALAGGGGPAHTVLVSGDLSPTANGTALRDAFAFVATQSPTLANPWVIKVGAGKFDLSYGVALAFPPNTHLVGAGKGATLITAYKAIFYSALGPISISHLSATVTNNYPFPLAEFHDENVTLDSVNFKKTQGNTRFRSFCHDFKSDELRTHWLQSQHKSG